MPAYYNLNDKYYSTLKDSKEVLEVEVYFDSNQNKLFSREKLDIWFGQSPNFVEFPLDLKVGCAPYYRVPQSNSGVYLKCHFSKDPHTQKFICDRDGGVSCELYGYYVLRFRGSKFVYAYSVNGDNGDDCLEYEAKKLGLRGYVDNPEYADEFYQTIEAALFE